MPTIYEWPTDWYSVSRASFRLQARSQVTPRTFIGGKSVYGPHAQIWVATITLAPQDWDAAGQWMAAFFSRLDGQAGLMRFGDPARRKPQFNRLTPGGSQAWSDSTFFNDGTGWASGLVPEVAYAAAAAKRGDNYLQIGGLQVSTSRVLRRGDLFELRPNGIATETPNLYEVQFDGTTNASGATGIEIRPRLRQDIAAGDMVVLTEPRSVFRLVDDDQGAPELGREVIADIAFNLVEAII